MEQYADEFERQCAALRARLATEENKSRHLEADRDALKEELAAEREDCPGGCAYWREAAKLREQERDALRERCEKLENALEEILRGVNADARSVLLARDALAATEVK